MNLKNRFAALLACLLMGCGGALFAQETAVRSPLGEELKTIVDRLQNKLRTGAHTKADLADEISALNELWSKHKDDGTLESGDIRYTYGILCLNVLGDVDQGIEVLQEAKKNFPDSKYAPLVDKVIESVKQRTALQKAKEAVIGQPAPDLRFIWSTQDGLEKLSSIKGKVILVDFWTTWCQPCVAAFPELKKLADRYHGYDVEILGVTSLQGRVAGLEEAPIICEGDPEKEMQLTAQFVRTKGINWTIGMTKGEIFDKGYAVSSIPHMAIIAPDGKVRYNGLNPATTSFAKMAEMIDALLKEANLKTPPGS